MTEMATAPQPELSPLQKLLNDIDTARAEQKGSLRDHTLRSLETRLAGMTPLAEGDVFTLMGRLADKALAPETRESIADNLSRAAPFTSLRYLRVHEWIAAREASVTNSRREREEVDKSVNRAIDLVTVAQAALNSTSPSGLVLNVSNVLSSVLSELDTATLFLSISDSVLDEPRPLLNDLWSRDQTEAQLFAEAQGSTVQ